MRYEVIRQDDPVLRERLKELAKARRRFGYRRLHVFLRREGFDLNHKRLFRIYREEQLHVRRRGGRKRAMGPDGAALDAEPALVTGFCVRSADGWTPVQDHDGGRRLHAGMSGPDRRYFAIGRKGGAGTGDAVRSPRQAPDDCQR